MTLPAQLSPASLRQVRTELADAIAALRRDVGEKLPPLDELDPASPGSPWSPFLPGGPMGPLIDVRVVNVKAYTQLAVPLRYTLP